MAAWQLLMEESFYYTNPKCFESDLPIFFSRENDQATNFKEKSKKAATGWIGKKRNFRENASQEDLQLQRSTTQK